MNAKDVFVIETAECTYCGVNAAQGEMEDIGDGYYACYVRRECESRQFANRQQAKADSVHGGGAGKCPYCGHTAEEVAEDWQ